MLWETRTVVFGEQGFLVGICFILGEYKVLARAVSAFILFQLEMSNYINEN